LAAVLKLEDVRVSYGQTQVLRGVSLEIEEGEIAAIIGSNGAGKTTCLRAICGLAPVPSNSVQFYGRPIDRMKPERIVRLGLVTVPQGRRIFPGLTVRENLSIATTCWRKRGMSMDAEFERVFKLFPVLEQRQNQLGWSFSGGEQQMLAVGRGLMSRPKLLLMDEPSMGLAPKVMDEMFEAIKKINREGTTVLLVEQNAFQALSVADRGFVLEQGRIALRDTAANLLKNEEVKKAYVGALAECLDETAAGA
jgi:branched-chain amino acid transport system ATP-binding protein